MSEPNVRPADLHNLLNRRNGRLPDWHRPRDGDPAMLVGSARAAYLHWLALLVAAGADIGAFKQVVGLAMRDQASWLVWLVVFGFTAVVLYLAHNVGVLLRNARIGRIGREPDEKAASRLGGWISRRTGAYLCVVVWLALGLVAYWVRLTVPPVQDESLGRGGPLGGGASPLGGGTGTAPDAYEAQSAALFVALYGATGLVAMVGAYLTHHPLRMRYMAAVRAHRKATEQAAASAYQLAYAEAARNSQAVELDSAERIREETERELCALAERLKQTARVAIASQAQDPAVTDAIFRQDDRPSSVRRPCESPGWNPPPDPTPDSDLGETHR